MLHTSESTGTSGKSRRLDPPQFPPVTFFKGRGYVLRSHFNQYKSALQAFALGVSPPEPKIVEPDPVRGIQQVIVGQTQREPKQHREDAEHREITDHG